MRRLTQLVVVVSGLAVGGAPLLECATADSMNASQMACCAAVDHDCGAAGMAQECCPTGSSDTHQLSASAIPQVHPAPVVTSGPAAWALPPSRHSKLDSAFEAFGREILKLPERPTYLLDSTFLI